MALSRLSDLDIQTLRTVAEVLRYKYRPVIINSPADLGTGPNMVNELCFNAGQYAVVRAFDEAIAIKAREARES
jgi:hypothetical protein